MLLFRFRGSQEQDLSGSLSVDWPDVRWEKTQDHFPGETGQSGSHHYGLAFMSLAKKKKAAGARQQTVDTGVASQAGDDLAWESSVRVKKSKATSVSIPSELAA